MKAVKLMLTMIGLVFLIGCSSNGKHLYVDGKCITCINNPFTDKPLNYGSSDNNKYQVITWKEFMLEGLSQKGITDLSPYNEDYLLYNIGYNDSLMKNEIAYKKEISKQMAVLRSELNSHELKRTYQITLPSKVGKYDFQKEEFPMNYSKSFILQGGNFLKALPKSITINIINFSELINFKIEADKADIFLSKRPSSRGLYVRYIIEITKMIDVSFFQAKVLEVQFIDIIPSVHTKKNKEEYMAYKTIKFD